jgi:Fe-S oxidoreductase
LLELKDHGPSAYCCGGGGGVVSNQRATALRYKVFELKLQQIEATGAKRFVTSCGQCRITFELGAKHAQWNRPTESLLELVADNLAE